MRIIVQGGPDMPPTHLPAAGATGGPGDDLHVPSHRCLEEGMRSNDVPDSIIGTISCLGLE